MSNFSRCSFIMGSPPHVRGKGDSEVICQRAHGITPACAGKSRCILQQLRVVKDHPRMCGEKRAGTGQHGGVQGSPPHVRGKGVVHVFVSKIFRITPACAGKRLSCSCRASQSWDHPRMCGEKKNTFRKLKASTGSPPHVRGKAVVVVGAIGVDGITPACAGKRPALAPPPRLLQDHPRMCGEKLRSRA